MNKLIESELKNFQVKKSPRADGFIDEFYQTFKEEFASSSQTLQKIEEEEVLPNSFYKASITVIPKSEKDNT